MPASATAARALISSAATGAGSRPAWPGTAARGAGGAGCGTVRLARARCQAVTPLPASTPKPSGNACARVQRGMPQVLVAGIQPAGGGDLAGIRAGARFSSRSAR